DEAEGHAVTRRHGDWRYGGRSLQGHLFGSAESGDQVHDLVWLARCGIGGKTGWRPGSDVDSDTGARLFPRLVCIRLPIVLRNADKTRRVVEDAFQHAPSSLAGWRFIFFGVSGGFRLRSRALLEPESGWRLSLLAQNDC